MAAKNKFLNAMKMPSIDDMFSSEADRQRESGDLVTEVPLSELHPFVGHPFEVRDDEDLTSLQYQIQQDKERLEKLQKRIQKEQVKYEPARHISKTLNEIDSMGQKTFTGKMAISQKDYSELTALAKEGITSRAEIKKFEQSANFYRQKYMDSANALERMKTKYNELKEKCRPFLEALEHFPEVAKLFTEKVKQLFSFKEAQERAEKEAREKERQERIKARKSKRGMER